MKEFKKIQIFSCIAIAFWIFSLQCQADTDKQDSELRLQWAIDHPTGYHQVSFVFKKDRVDLFTNTSLWQGALSPRLGHFTSALNEKWQAERGRIGIYLSLLRERPPMDDSRFLLKAGLPKGMMELIQEDPHVPVVRLNGYGIREEDDDITFSALEGILSAVWKSKWSCVDCVIYKPHRGNIERQRIKDGKTNKVLFSREQMRCYPINNKLLECTDTYGGPTDNGWGSFQISL